MTAHDNRAELTKNLVAEQTVYRINLAINAIITQKAGYAVDKDVFDATFNGCMGNGEQLKNPMWFDHDWLAQKSDMFQSAYIASTRNLAALSLALHRAKIGESVYSFHYACTDAMDWKSPVVIPNAPVVYVSFLHRTDSIDHGFRQRQVQLVHGHVLGRRRTARTRISCRVMIRSMWTRSPRR